MTRTYTPSQIADAILAGTITRDSVFVLMSEIENLRAEIERLQQENALMKSAFAISYNMLGTK